MPPPAAAPAEASRRVALPTWLQLAIGGAVAYRLVYHSTYLAEVPFAVATFADGAVYEQAARDILDHPPLGTKPFYLQGIYAYFMALAMTVRAWPSLALLCQLALAGLALWGFFRAAATAWGRLVAGLSLLILLLHPALAFYENKYLTASLAVSAEVFVLLAFAVYWRRPAISWAVLVGVASAWTVLVRPNMALALPFTAWALVATAREAGRSWGRPLAAAMFGLMVTLAPMAARNWIVTETATVFRADGGGAAFYTGNNSRARGVWNDGGMLSGTVSAERVEIADALGLEGGEPGDRMGRALYRRAFDWILDHPIDWMWLELRKLWLTCGDDELTQDYDWYGERESIRWAHRVGVPFSWLFALGLLGIFGIVRRVRAGDPQAKNLRPWLLVVVGQASATLAANLLFFTSSQHRLPLVVPLAFVAGPGLAGLLGLLHPRWAPPWAWPPRRLELVLAGLIVAQGIVPRSKRKEPSPVHYYNLALVQRSVGEPAAALESLDRALAQRPSHPVFLLQRAELLMLRERRAEAERDLDVLLTQPDVPVWLRRNAEALSAALEGGRDAMSPSIHRVEGGRAH